MANIKISDLTSAASVVDANQFEINEAGTSKKVTASQIQAYVDSNLGALAQLDTVNAATITDNSVGAAELNVTGNGTSGQLLSSDGDGTMTWIDATSGSSGAASIVLNSGTTNVTLTSASDQLQFVFPEGNGYSITMPDATTLTKGDNTFVFYNPTSYAVALKDNGSTVREYLAPNTTISFKLKDNSTSNGIWVLANPVLGGYSNITSGTVLDLSSNISGNNIKNICKVNDTQYVIVSVDSVTDTYYAKLLTVNLSTKAVTWGNGVSFGSIGGLTQYNYGQVGGDSNGVDKGVILYSHQDASTNFQEYIHGFAIVSGTLYVSSRQTIYSASGNNARGVSVAMYCGSDDAFLIFGGNGDTTVTPKARGAKVTVSGTTVTTTLSGTTYTGATGTAWSFAPTSLTSLVVDDTTNTIKDYINYVPSTNTLTSGVRTAQTSIIAGSDLNSGVMAPAASFAKRFADNLFTRGIFNGRKSLVTNAAGTKIFWLNKILDVANPGTANVTVSLSSYTSKPYLATNYVTSTVGATGIPAGEGGFTDSLTLAADDIRLLDNVQASNNVNYTTDSNPGQKPYIFLHKADPSTSTFNLNFGSQALVNYTLYPYWAYYLSTGSIIVFNLPSLYAFTTGSLDIFTAASTFEG